MSAYPEVTGPDPSADPQLAALLQSLRDQHDDAISAVLVYGSCLRSGDIYDGLLDLYLICDSYRAAYGTGTLAVANWLLPPNVFYAQQAGEGRTLRAKVTVISLGDFRRGCSLAWFESYIWGRFAQPTHILYARDGAAREAVGDALLEAVRTLLTRTLPALPTSGSLEELWKGALGLSYGTELRTERSGRAGELVRANAAFYAAVTAHHAAALGHGFSLRGNAYHSAPGGLSRALTRTAWRLRGVQGKLLSIARLVKALFTFEGGLDYIAWKLERHSGETIVIPDKVRRRPLVHLWGFFWGLYQRGIFK